MQIKMKIPLLFLVVSPFAVLPGISSLMPMPHQLCSLQLSLVNYACAGLPLTPLLAPSSTLMMQIPTQHPPPPSPLPPPPPPPFLHMHMHRHRRRPAPPVEEICCKWLKTVDLECACNVLVFLPNFLARPNHKYTLVVGNVCRVTFTCGGRLRP